jgi:hypothetical protein
VTAHELSSCLGISIGIGVEAKGDGGGGKGLFCEAYEFAFSPILNLDFGAVKSSVVISHFLMKLVVFLNGLHVHVIDG